MKAFVQLASLPRERRDAREGSGPGKTEESGEGITNERSRAMSYEKGQTVEVRHAGAWRPGRYEREAQAGGTWHDVFVDVRTHTLRFSSDEIRPGPPPAKGKPRSWLTVQIGVVRYSEADARAKAENFALNNPGRQFVVVPMPDKVCVLDAKPEWRDA